MTTQVEVGKLYEIDWFIYETLREDEDVLPSIVEILRIHDISEAGAAIKRLVYFTGLMDAYIDVTFKAIFSVLLDLIDWYEIAVLFDAAINEEGDSLNDHTS